MTSDHGSDACETSCALPRHDSPGASASACRLPRGRSVALVGVPVVVVVLGHGGLGDRHRRRRRRRPQRRARRPRRRRRGRDELRAEVEAYAADLADTAVRPRHAPAATYSTTAGDLGLTVDIDATAERGPRRRPRLRRCSARSVGDLVRRRPTTSNPCCASTSTPPTTRSSASRARPACRRSSRRWSLEDGRLSSSPASPAPASTSRTSPNGCRRRRCPAPTRSCSPSSPCRCRRPTTDDAVQAGRRRGQPHHRRAPHRRRRAARRPRSNRATQRAWLRLDAAAGQPPSLTLDEEAALADLADRFPDLGEPPVDATVTLGDAGAPGRHPGPGRHRAAARPVRRHRS